MRNTCLFLTIVIGLSAQSVGALAGSAGIPVVKQTPLGKYISSKEAFNLLGKNPEIQTDVVNKKLGEYSLVDNPHFMESMEKLFKNTGKSKDAKIIITCGSGYRSAEAVRILSAAGYTNVWHIPDGYPGDEKPGLNANNAWKLNGLPWSYELIQGSEWIKLLDK